MWLINSIKYCFNDILFFIKNGYSISELWNLSYHISKMILPKLKAFRKYSGGTPGSLTIDEWHNILDEMIWTFEWEVSGKSDNPDMSIEEWENIYDANWKRYNNGLKLFAEYFRELWY